MSFDRKVAIRGREGVGVAEVASDPAGGVTPVTSAPPPPGPAKKKTYGRRRGRPSRETIADEDLSLDFRPPHADAEAKGLEGDFHEFLFRVFKFPDLDEYLHGALADFLGQEGAVFKLRKDRHYPTRVSLQTTDSKRGSRSIPPESRTQQNPYGVSLNGGFKGAITAYRGDGKRKLILTPRGHLKSTIVTVAYAIWRIVRQPAIRILIANDTATNSSKFVRQIEWQFLHNPEIERLWPHLHVTQQKIVDDHLLWQKNAFVVPREVAYGTGEATVEGVGVGGNLVSRHYDLIIADDLVNGQNTRTPDRMENTRDWFQNSFALLEPDGDVVVVGTRWHYQDLYAELISEGSRYSLFLATATGEDGKCFFPKKYNEKELARIRAELQSAYKFSCQYYNQPVDQESAEFKASWVKWYFPRPPDLVCNYFAIMDPAFTESEGDATGLIVLSVDEKNDWYIRKVWKLRIGNIPGIIDAIFEMFDEYPDIVTFAIETRGFQRAISHGLREQMEKRDRWFPITELKAESNRSKIARIMRLAPRFEAGKIYLLGRDGASAEGAMRDLFNEILRFPKGHDDLIDTLAYAYDVVYPPGREQVDEERSPSSMAERVKRKVEEVAREGKGPVDEHMGSEY